MRKSIVIATTLVAGGTATSLGALNVPTPYYGSDTLLQLTNEAIANAGLGTSTSYVAGGSATGQAGMANRVAANAIQQTAPMTSMLSSAACQFNLASGTAGTFTTNATGIVIGLDAVDVLSSTLTGGQSACQGTADQAGTGLAYSGSNTFGSAGNKTNSLQNWKYILALVYGGNDVTTGTVDCNQPSRQNLVSNWSNLFQVGAAGGCTFPSSGTGSVCVDANHNGVLWHAFRRDDSAGTASVFASLIGISPSLSQTANNGFGTSPFCNALNWDAQSNNNGGVKAGGTTTTACSFGGHDQWTGPGGIVDPNSLCVISNGVCSASNTPGFGNHRRPPPGTWGDSPDPSQTSNSADVLPTDMQDNDPIRRPCIGSALNATKPAENVCNLDGQLGLVLSVVDTEFVERNLSLQQYPTTACNGSFIFGNPVNVATCAPFKSATNASGGLLDYHSGECPNGDSLIGGSCLVPVSASSSQCLATSAISPSLVNRNLPAVDGRVYNFHLRDGDLNDGSCAYIEQTVQTGTAIPFNRDLVGGLGRIHSVNTIFAGTSTTQVGCQLLNPDDQIGCSVQADPCSIGQTGDDGKLWNLHTGSVTVTDGPYTLPTTQVTTASRIDQVLPQASSAQLLGVQTQAGGIEYQLGRKLYFNSIIGFGNIIGAGDTADNASTGAELTLAEFESTGPNDINPVLADVGFFTTGSLAAALSNSSGTLTGGAANTPFCEDFNQTIVCVQAATVTTTNGSTAITFSANTTLSATALLSFSNQSGVQYGLASAITASTTGTLATAYTGTGGAKQSYSLAPTNDNACFRNPAGVVNDNSGTATTQTGAPTGAASAAANANVNSTVCGNGVQDAFEECDNGTANGTSGNPCSVACRCAGRNSYEPGGIAPTGGYACQ